MSDVSSEGVAVVTDNICVTVKNADGTLKKLLNDVNFVALPGEMTALMGPSGAGKTTLLNVLAKRLSGSSQVIGDVIYGGRSDVDVNAFTSYVMQEDCFLEYLTVKETITFAARLRLRQLTFPQQTDRVETIMAELGLLSCSDVYVGGRTVKGISGGQKKRVSIAVALLSDPKVLMLDEPTSGLDASLAYTVIRALSKVAADGKTVICTIHQPRSQVYAHFDKLILLHNGEVVYRGLRSSAVTFFEEVGHPCPENFNPPDFFLDLLTEASTAQALKREGSAARMVISSEEASQFVSKFKASKYHDRDEETRHKYMHVHAPVEDTQMRKTGLKDGLEGIRILILRGVCEGKRKPSNVTVGLMVFLCQAIVIGSVFWQLPKPDVSVPMCDVTTLRNFLGGVMQLVGVAGFSAFDAGTQAVTRRPLVNREASSGLYKRIEHELAMYVVDGCFHYWGIIVFTLISYFMVGLEYSGSTFFKSWFVIMLAKFTFWGYSTWIGNMAPNEESVSGLIPLGTVPLFISSGFQISDNAMPKWLIWLKSISPTRFAFQSVSKFQLHNDQYLYNCMGFRTPDAWTCVGIIAGLAFVFRACSLLAGSTMHKNAGIQA